MKSIRPNSRIVTQAAVAALILGKLAYGSFKFVSSVNHFEAGLSKTGILCAGSCSQRGGRANPIDKDVAI